MQLVNIVDVVPDAMLDIRYATDQNFTGRQLYDHPFAQLDILACQALGLVADELRQQNYALVIWDAYRPLEVQQQLLAALRDERYVATHSNHCEGRALDVTICSPDGTYLDMGTDHDSFTELAHSSSNGLSDVQIKNRQLLVTVMSKYGFKQWPYEWWHFDYVIKSN